MKKILATIFVASLVVGADAYTLLPGTTNNVSWLPLGSTNVMIAQLEKEIDMIVPMLSSNGTNYWSFGGWTNYDASKGAITEMYRQSVTNTLNATLGTNFEGHTVWLFSSLSDLAEEYGNYACTCWSYALPFTTNWYDSYPVWPRSFTVHYANGVVQVPPKLLRWPYVSAIPVTGARAGVQMVKYVYTDTNGVAVSGPNIPSENSWWPIATPTGTMVPMNTTNWMSDDVLYLDTVLTDPDYIRTNHYHGEVRLYYEWGQFDYSPDGQRILNPDGTTYRYYPTMYDAFDMLTGQKIHSCAVKLGVIMTNGAPLITVHSAPGTEVQIQTSSDMKNWTGSDATTICTGKGGWVTFSPPSPVSGTTGATVVQSASPQFFRAVRLYPP